MSKFSGITSTTPKKLLLDAGAFFKNYDLAKTYAENVTEGNLLGATSGGGSFSAVPTVRNVAIDGAPTNVKGLKTIDEWVVTITAKVKEITADNMAVALGAATSSTVAATPAPLTGYTKIVGNSDIADTDYLENITWVGRQSNNSEKPVIIVLKNALDANGLSISPADKGETTMDVTVTGHYAIDDLETPPFEIYYPAIA